MHYVTLVFSIIGTARKSHRAFVVFFNSCMMPSGNSIKTKQSCTLAQSIKLEVTVALDAWVWRKAIHVCFHIWVNNVLVEIIRKVEHQVIDAQLLRNTARIIYVGNRTATGVAFAAPQTHGDSNYFMTSIFEFCCSDRRIDASRHGHEHFHTYQGYGDWLWLVRQRRNCVTAPTMVRTAVSISASVVVWPRLSRRAPFVHSRERPIAAST